jgi:sigma-B regulation protein RsbU (phosphoserine phosphatase)
MKHVMENCFRLPDAIRYILAEITVDLAECIDSTWAVAFTEPYSNPLPLCAFGQVPDVKRCPAHIPFAHATQAGSIVECSDCAMARIMCPVQVHGETVAALLFGPKQFGADYEPRDRELIKRSASHLAFILGDEHLAAKVAGQMARHLRRKRELASARDVQDRLFTYRPPAIPGLDYYGGCWPVGELSGDFFDFAASDNSVLSVTIGDVSGKGAPAALTMAFALGSLKALGSGSQGTPSELVGRLNRNICDVSSNNVFASMFHARFDALRQELQYVNAGQDGVFLLRDGLKQMMKLETTGTVLGLNTQAEYQQRSVSFAPGDVLVAATDGITEASDVDGRMLDDALLLDAVRNCLTASSSDIALNLIRIVDAHLKGSEPHDDRTVVVVQFKLETGAPVQRSVPLRSSASAQAA